AAPAAPSPRIRTSAVVVISRTERGPRCTSPRARGSLNGWLLSRLHLWRRPQGRTADAGTYTADGRPITGPVDGATGEPRPDGVRISRPDRRVFATAPGPDASLRHASPLKSNALKTMPVLAHSFLHSPRPRRGVALRGAPAGRPARFSPGHVWTL